VYKILLDKVKTVKFLELLTQQKTIKLNTR
jgi:hypothetical protein